MKRIISLLLSFMLLLGSIVSLSSCDDFFNPSTGGGAIDCLEGNHSDNDEDDWCDICGKYVIVVIDFYSINDLHGKFCDTDSQPGVDELASYLRYMQETDDNTVFLSTGDMWQGTAESNLSGGHILTEWMNELGFVSMTLGNHEFDWGEDAIRSNLEIAQFPFLAINVYDVKTNQLADYCTPSVLIERGGIKIGIIGAIGDCYSSISSDKVKDVKFKVDNQLTALVKAESDKLRAQGADVIVYSLHDGHDSSSSGKGVISGTNLQSYYSPMLSDGYVDLVFEAHTHQSYTLTDPYGVYHLQGGGENKGISHAEIAVNSATGKISVTDAGMVKSNTYTSMPDDPATEALEEKYADIINMAYSPLGTVSAYYDDSEVEAKIAELYLEVGLEKWSAEYDIVLGGGFLRTRSPYNLSRGEVTYADILSLLPFDNNIVLCSVSGYHLKNKFINTTNTDYYNAYSQFGEEILNSISDSSVYYIVVDTYTALYAPNNLTIVEYFDYSTYARDLLAEAVRNGEL